LPGVHRNVQSHVPEPFGSRISFGSGGVPIHDAFQQTLRTKVVVPLFGWVQINLNSMVSAVRDLSNTQIPGSSPGCNRLRREERPLQISLVNPCDVVDDIEGTRLGYVVDLIQLVLFVDPVDASPVTDAKLP